VKFNQYSLNCRENPGAINKIKLLFINRLYKF